MTKQSKFIKEIIQDIESKSIIPKFRFPPEPNGYLHIGHCKAIHINFELAKQFNTVCNLRMDDTNPVTSKLEYVNQIIKDVKWLGYDFNLTYCSDNFNQLYNLAIELIKQGNAYIDCDTPEQISLKRTNPKIQGIVSVYRERSVEENLELFKDMYLGKYKSSDNYVLRAKIDMNSTNMQLRDPILYRVKEEEHYRTKDNKLIKWYIYPTYDFAHGLTDCIEGITHSICTLEFENHKPLYNWLNQCLFKSNLPTQIEMARLNIEGVITSKRQLKSIIEDSSNDINSYEDERLFTIAGLRNKGYSAKSLLTFCQTVGYSKRESVTDIKLLYNISKQDFKHKNWKEND